MSIDHDSDAARLARHRDLFRLVHPDVSAANRTAPRVASDEPLVRSLCAAYDNRAGHPRDAVDISRELLGEAIDHIDWIEKGLAEWRSESQRNARYAEAARATARVAIGHLQAVLNGAKSHYEQQLADTAARDWLLSIGNDAP